MAFNPDIHHRRSIRLQGYDYSQAGAYFITVCTPKRECLFGEILNGEMYVNPYGKIVDQCWLDLPNHYENVHLGEYVVMPNHFHGIVMIADMTTVGAGLKPAPTVMTQPAPTVMAQFAATMPNAKKRHGLPEIVRALKTFSSRRINDIRKTPGIPVWQRNYYEHIIRDDESLYRITDYIKNNLVNWDKDDYYAK